MTTSPGTYVVALLMFDDMDLLDFGGPYEVLLTANRLAERDGRQQPFDVHTVSLDGEAVTAYGGVGLLPHAGADQALDAHVVVVPGAIAIDRVCGDDQVIAFVDQLTSTARIVTSVCTGAFLLAKIGKLAGRPWTTHWEDVPELARRLDQHDAADATESSPSTRLVDDGDVITAGGLSCGLDLGLILTGNRSLSAEMKTIVLVNVDAVSYY